MKLFLVDCDNKNCNEKVATYGGVPGAPFTKRRKFCSRKCVGEATSRIKFNPHNIAMRKAKYTVNQNDKWIFNSPFRKETQ